MKPEDIADLKQLIEFLQEYQVAEFDLDRGDTKIRLKFNQQQSGTVSLGELGSVLSPAQLGVAHTGGGIPIASTGAAAVPSAADPNEGLHVLKSPIVGTYYGSPSPGAAPFVAVGDRVEKGQVVCIIEAMKLMNEIECDATGEIVKCLVSNGQAIEFGQPLFSVRVS
ncbi:MAG TPA: acetyl-CoA carboxylase biotin carboxyl carrier protein [Terracidiphilus sp.]|jgi:acetyl-CoA carboxylase biotin carboxyl carrier protein|nr:acetyl-CoA carboxylase biotin carboxyl carrier protein [Terracidiphilus sp.]HUX28313.1 acetyl-CoA carboxylase biotin carboxyl carrier protein [Terracidiphilus sp.]